MCVYNRYTIRPSKGVNHHIPKMLKYNFCSRMTPNTIHTHYSQTDRHSSQWGCIYIDCCILLTDTLRKLVRKACVSSLSERLKKEKRRSPPVMDLRRTQMHKCSGADSKVRLKVTEWVCIFCHALFLCLWPSSFSSFSDSFTTQISRTPPSANSKTGTNRQIGRLRILSCQR